MPTWLKKLIEILKKLVFVPAPDFEPEPKPEPEPVLLDELAPALITWGEAKKPGSWKITAKILRAKMTHDGVEAVYQGTEQWPLMPGTNPKQTIGNWWIVANIDGKWHGSTIEWLGRGKTKVVDKKWDGADDFHGMLTNWRPKSGETAYLMLSTVARGGPYTIEERSQLKQIAVP